MSSTWAPSRAAWARQSPPSRPPPPPAPPGRARPAHDRRHRAHSRAARTANSIPASGAASRPTRPRPKPAGPAAGDRGRRPARGRDAPPGALAPPGRPRPAQDGLSRSSSAVVRSPARPTKGRPRPGRGTLRGPGPRRRIPIGADPAGAGGEEGRRHPLPVLGRQEGDQLGQALPAGEQGAGFHQAQPGGQYVVDSAGSGVQVGMGGEEAQAARDGGQQAGRGGITGQKLRERLEKRGVMKEQEVDPGGQRFREQGGGQLQGGPGPPHPRPGIAGQEPHPVPALGAPSRRPIIHEPDEVGHPGICARRQADLAP